LGGWDLIPEVSHHAFKQISVCATDRVFTPSCVSPLHAELPFKIPDYKFSHLDVAAADVKAVVGSSENKSGDKSNGFLVQK